MRTFEEQDASAEMEKWWRQMQSGDRVLKVLAPLDYSQSFAQVASCRAWCEGKVKESTSLLSSETRARVKKAYADLAAERIAAGVQVIRIVLMDMEALKDGRPGWRDWLIEQQLARVIIPLTGETVYCMPVAELPNTRQLDKDINVFGELGVMQTFYSADGPGHRDFYYTSEGDDLHEAGLLYAEGVLKHCKDEHRIWPDSSPA